MHRRQRWHPPRVFAGRVCFGLKVRSALRTPQSSLSSGGTAGACPGTVASTPVVDRARACMSSARDHLPSLADLGTEANPTRGGGGVSSSELRFRVHCDLTNQSINQSIMKMVPNH